MIAAANASATAAMCRFHRFAQLYMGVDEYCKHLCNNTYTTSQVVKFMDRIRLDYHVNWCVVVVAAVTRRVSAAWVGL